MPQALPLQTRITQNSRRQRTNRVIKTQFGDGYSQIRPDGINSQYDTWELGFDTLNASDRATMIAFLDAIGGWDYFTWQPIGDTVVKKWKIKDGFQETPMSGNLYSIQFTAVQFF